MATFQSASGWSGIEASPLSRILYSDVIISKQYEEDWLYRITNAALLEPVTMCGQRIQLMIAPEVGPMRSYQLNQEMVPNTVTTTARWLDICNLAYQDIKFDDISIAMACDRWQPYKEKVLESIYQRLVEHQRKFVLGRMMAEVSPLTSLKKAGKLGNINLGAPGEPIHVTPTNLPKILMDLQLALLEQHRWKDGEMFILVPPILRQYIAMSNFSNSEWSCECGTIVKGMWDKPLAGFQVIESTELPVRVDATGALSYYILAGHRDATAYAANIIKSRSTDADVNTFSTRFQFVVAWGAEVIYPDALAMGYWTFDPIQ